MRSNQMRMEKSRSFPRVPTFERSVKGSLRRRITSRLGKPTSRSRIALARHFRRSCGFAHRRRSGQHGFFARSYQALRGWSEAHARDQQRRGRGWIRQRRWITQTASDPHAQRTDGATGADAHGWIRRGVGHENGGQQLAGCTRTKHEEYEIKVAGEKVSERRLDALARVCFCQLHCMRGFSVVFAISIAASLHTLLASQIGCS